MAVFSVLLGCAHRDASRPPPGERAQDLCGQDAPDSPAHCECLGGYVRGEDETGKVACPQGETELSRVRQGIEGAVCCKR